MLNKTKLHSLSGVWDFHDFLSFLWLFLKYTPENQHGGPQHNGLAKVSPS